MAARLAQGETALDAFADEFAQARAELAVAARGADVARAVWLRAKAELEAELVKINAGLRGSNGVEVLDPVEGDRTVDRGQVLTDFADGRSRILLPDWVRQKETWARKLLGTERVPGEVLARLTTEARQTLSEYLPGLNAAGPGTAELREVLYTILTAERVHYHRAGESPASAAALLRVLARELTDAVEAAWETAGRARRTWGGRWDGQSGLSARDRRTIALMVEGFVDAAVAARPGQEVMLRGGVFVSPDSGRAAIGRVLSLVDSAVRNRLNAYPPGAARLSAKELSSRVRVSEFKRPSGDQLVGSVQLQVQGQRPALGLFGPEVFTDPADPLPRRAEELTRARADLARARLEDSDPLFSRAREIVNLWNQPPRTFVETAPWVDSAHRARYRAAVDLVAWELHRHDDDEQGLAAAHTLSRVLVSEVMWPREK
ncbi:hypothetical protein, partial [Amycolatopsis sp. NPDC102389]|uniref:hypothetical protein n=1 Tax=Amycolatopsis sp. NPDC102389 TaxID=3363941 RepID=UPI003825E863